ncbi:unnamed protein product [Rotaria sp. Silwood1]|nr:unnamed protein product [Rotaria sp. Silwood1]
MKDGLAPMEAPPSTIIAYACAADSVSAAGVGKQRNKITTSTVPAITTTQNPYACGNMTYRVGYDLYGGDITSNTVANYTLCCSWCQSYSGCVAFPRLSVQPIRVSFKNAHASKTRIQRLYDDGIDLKQQSVEINALERIRRCTFYKDVDIWTFYKTLCPNVRTLGDVLEEGCVASKDGPCLGHLQSSGSVKSVEWLSYSMTMKANDLCSRPTIDPHSIATFIMTSGTTGDPKIAMVSHDNLLATAKGNIMRLEQANIKQPLTLRHCSFLPMTHIYERFILLGAFLRGTQVVFCPTPEQLVNYFAIVKPTQVSVVPRVLNKVYDMVMAEVNKSKVKRFLVQQALDSEESWFLSRLVFRRVKKLFGGEVQAMITAASPITSDVMHFFRIALDIPIMEGYGQTESAGAGTSTHPVDISYGTVGSPLPTVEIKLIDVPGTNYRSEINQGEVCIRGPNIFKGYYSDETKTREIIDKDGWLHTGDVGEWTNNGALRIIDRTKHIFKLSNGKYIAPERLEDVYIRSRWVAQIFVDGVSSQSTVVAVVIPDEEYVRNNFESTGTFVDVCNKNKLKQIILTDLIRLAKEYQLKPYETVSNIHIHHELFSQANELLTVTLKTRRANARKKFQTIINSLYHEDQMTTNNPM